MRVSLQVGDRGFVAKLYDDETVHSFLSMLPLQLDMSELNGNEKYFYLPGKLPTNSGQVATTRTGDLMLYGSSCVVVFYKSFPTSYGCTRLGHIEDTTGLAEALGKGEVRIFFSVIP